MNRKFSARTRGHARWQDASTPSGGSRQATVPFVAMAEAYVLDALNRAGVKPNRIRPALDDPLCRSRRPRPIRG
ncbi:hypothetical protein ACIBF6_20860 [Streptosporangium amethystogenes]|uniref:hypothetical protein n=1 Tax=Streptosporangium amethystogenes TaxID=2002 RepID=UPI00379D4459